MPEQSEKYTQIENDILDRLFSWHLTPNQWQVITYIIRMTKGFHKEMEYITNQKISDETQLGNTVVCRVLKDLETMQIVTRKGKILGIQNDVSKWQKLAILSRKVSRIANNSSDDQKLAGLLTSEAETTQKLAISSTSEKLAISSTSVSNPANFSGSLSPTPPITGIKETIQKKTTNLTPLPDFLKKETWAAFEEMRKKIRAPLTETAKVLIFKDLERIRSQTGDDPNEVLEQSIMRGWRGVFPVKRGGYGNNQKNNNGHSRSAGQGDSVEELERFARS